MTRLEAYRRDKGLTQSEIADLVGCSQPYISALERRRRSPTMVMAKRIAQRTNDGVPVVSWVEASEVEPEAPTMAAE